MSGYQSYPEYKDSGVEWLGEVPKHWEIKKLKFVAVGQPSNVDKKTEDNEEPVLLCNYTDVYKNEFIDSSFEFMKATATKTEIEKFSVDVGDVIVTKDSESPDDIAVPAYVVEKVDGLVCGYHLTQIKGKDIDGKYLFRLFQSLGFSAQFVVAANGVTRFGLPQYAISNAFTSIPPETEQQTIARFLDHKTAQIDALIAKKQTLLEKLAEKRTALISHTVTKGLDANVKMKDSGVEWLGRVPAHWNVKRIKFVVTFIGSGKTPRGGGEVYVNEGIMLLRSQNVHDDGLRLSDVVFITDEADAAQSGTRVKSRDVLLNITGASIGRASVVPHEFPPANVNQHVCILRPNDQLILPDYLHLLLCSVHAKDQIVSSENGTSREGLNFQQVANLIFTFPPIGEQERILTATNVMIQRLEMMREKAISAIEKLKEYRSALITQAVTGKIDVLNVKIPEATTKGQAA